VLGYIWVGIPEFWVGEGNLGWVGTGIIGCKGANMKDIKSSCGDPQLKLRLRGRHSGFYEEDLIEDGMIFEADCPLMLCLSCSDEKSYQAASAAVVKLVSKVHTEYYKYWDKGPGLEAKVVRGDLPGWTRTPYLPTGKFLDW
jgi:hypothetical protein